MAGISPSRRSKPVSPLISFVLPWYKKGRLFPCAIAQNHIYRDPRCEVVIAMDEPSEESLLLEVIQQHPGIRFRVLVNDEPHDWRPPCKAINVGIRHSLGHYVVVMSPESVIRTPDAEYLFNLLPGYSQWFTLGHCYNLEFSPAELAMHPSQFSPLLDQRFREQNPIGIQGYGFLITSRKALFDLQGYDEARKGYGGDDDDIRIRLNNIGCDKFYDPKIKVFHLWHHETYREYAKEPFGLITVLNQPAFGTTFGRVAYDWKLIQPYEQKNNRTPRLP